METKNEVPPLVTKTIFGKNLCYLRKVRGGAAGDLTQQYIVDRLRDWDFDYTFHVISSYERGETFPPLNVAHAICIILGTTMDAMLYEMQPLGVNQEQPL